MAKTITIDPVTRLEGHGKISIFLDDAGDVDRAIFQVPELRGFEAFCKGRPAEEMPQITSRICGVCPTAHHMAATKTLDDLYGVEPPPRAKAIRELFYCLFMLEDHALHYYFLGGPDFIVGPQAPAAERNILGVIAKVGTEVAKRVIRVRETARELMRQMGGKPIHPVLGLPGGAPRGTLVHHYETDSRGVLTGVNLMVATLFNSAPICMSIEKAARKLIRKGEVNEGLLNQVEMAFRAYDPCFSCATHSLPGKRPLEVLLRDAAGHVIRRLRRS